MLYVLEETGKRLLQILTENFGRPLTVQEIADHAKRDFGTGHYSNTYNELRKMKAAGLIRWESKGRNAIIQLDPVSPILPDHLAHLEAIKRQRLAAHRPDAAPKLRELSASLTHDPHLESAWLLEAARSIRLNRWPILRIYAQNTQDRAPDLRDATRADARIEALDMTREEFQKRLAGPGLEPLRAWFVSSACLLGADRFWLGVLDAARGGSPFWLTSKDEAPGKDAIVASLAHYGYEEFGRSTASTPILPLESLALFVMRSGTERQKRALGPILAKNPFNPALLAFAIRREGGAACAELGHIIHTTRQKSKAMTWMVPRLLKGATGD